MITARIDPPELQPIAGAAHVTIAEGTRTVYVSGQTGIRLDGGLEDTLGAQAVQALRNLRVALKAGGADLEHVAKLMIYIVDYAPASLEALIEAAIGEYGEDFPVTASTLVGVAALFQPGLLIEIDAVAVV